MCNCIEKVIKVICYQTKYYDLQRYLGQLLILLDPNLDEKYLFYDYFVSLNFLLNLSDITIGIQMSFRKFNILNGFYATSSLLIHLISLENNIKVTKYLLYAAYDNPYNVIFLVFGS